MKRIWWKKLNSSGRFPDERIKLDVHFTDGEGNTYIWTAPWDKVNHLFVEGFKVEDINKPKSKELQLFKESVKEVLSAGEEIKDAYIEEGRILKIEEGNFMLEKFDEEAYRKAEAEAKIYGLEEEFALSNHDQFYYAVRVSVPEWLVIDIDFLRNAIGKKFEFIVINGKTVAMKQVEERT